MFPIDDCPIKNGKNQVYFLVQLDGLMTSPRKSGQVVAGKRFI